MTRPPQIPARFPLAAVLGLLLVLGCGDGDSEPSGDGAASASDPAPAAPVIESVELVDSIPWETELEAGVLHRIVVRHGGQADTIPAIMTDERPHVVGDTIVTGIAHSDGRVTRGFVYDPERRRVESVPLPDDFAGFLAHAISPDGRFLAYVGRREDGLLDANVARWPSGQAVQESHPVEGYPSDARNSAVEWSGGEVEIRIRLPVVDPERSTWLVVRGSPTGSFASDTVSVTGG